MTEDIYSWTEANDPYAKGVTTAPNGGFVHYDPHTKAMLEIEHPWRAGDNFPMLYASPATLLLPESPLRLDPHGCGEAVPSGDAQGNSRVRIDALALSPITDYVVTPSIDTVTPSPLPSIHFAVADLPGDLLGQASGNTITLDVDAAGYGWFIDATPGEDSEFDPDYAAKHDGEISPAANRVDLLTVVMHEMGHLLGWEHSDDPNDLMYETLPLGTRRTWSNELIDRFFETDDQLESDGVLDEELFGLLATRDRRA